jgi:hypothetical protein
MAKMPHFVRKLLLHRRIQWSKYEPMGSHEPGTPNPPLSYEVSAEKRGVSGGFVPVLVGKERKRFMVATGHMNHPLMAVLLETSAEEMGFQRSGALRVACDEVSFQRLLCLMEREAFN